MAPETDYPFAPEPPPPVAWVTWAIIGSTVAVFLLQLAQARGPDQDALGTALAFSTDAWREGRFWTLITYAWAHATALPGFPGMFWLHIVANMIPLVCLGPALEGFIGHVRFLGLYLGAAVAAALVWWFFNSTSDEGIIGASGAVFGLIAAVGTAAPRARVVVYLFFILPIPMRLRWLAIVVCGLEALQAFFHWMPEVAHSAHLGGAAFGFLYILGLRYFPRRNSIPI
jgi:membrane associated rhomboid family serine protease